MNSSHKSIIAWLNTSLCILIHELILFTSPWRHKNIEMLYFGLFDTVPHAAQVRVCFARNPNSICHCNNYVDLCKTLIIKWAWCHSFHRLWLNPMSLILCKISNMMSGFSTILSPSPVFCCFFLSIVLNNLRYLQHQSFHTIIKLGMKITNQFLNLK